MNNTTRGRGLGKVTLERINACYDILQEIQPASVRAVCYKLFGLKLIPDMSKNSTNKISEALTKGRESGYIPWEWIVDENREMERVEQWDSPDDYAATVRRAYRRDHWQHQASRVEIWSEKGTMRGTIKPVLDRYGVGFRVMHGFGSATTVNEVAEDTQRNPKPLQVFYLGDWDPSGMHMSEVDFPNRLSRYGAQLNFQRLALTKADTESTELAGLSFPAESKKKDTRHRWFHDHIGNECWEIDALSPVAIRDRVEDAILSMIEPEIWQRYEAIEAVELESLNEVLQTWSDMKAS